MTESEYSQQDGELVIKNRRQWYKVVLPTAHQGAGYSDEQTIHFIYATNMEIPAMIHQIRGWKRHMTPSWELIDDKRIPILRQIMDESKFRYNPKRSTKFEGTWIMKDTQISVQERWRELINIQSSTPLPPSLSKK